MLKEALSLKLQQGIKDYIMDFKDILKQFDKVTEKEDNKLLGEKKKTRPSNMLTESAEVVEPVSNELKLPSLKNVFEELSIEPAKPGAQEIHKDGQTIGTVSNPTVANQLKTAMDAGELTIGEQEIQEAEDWIDKAVKKPGAFKAQAERAGMSTSAFAKHVLANKDKFNAKTEKRANLAKTFSKMKETDTPPESSMDLTSPISGGNMRESDGSGSYGGQSPLSYDTQRSSKMKVKEEIKLQQITPKMGDNGSNTQSVISGKKVKEGAQYPADDGSPNSTNDEKGNAAANAALAANDSDTPQLVKEKAKGKVSKSSKLPSISKVKSMCSEGLSTSQIKQLHPKCNQQELNIMIKNTKTNLKEGAEHILKAAKHMGKSHGLCKGSYACPHDAGSEGARAYHEGYKTGLDEACGMKNTYEDATDGFSADAQGMGIRNKPIAGMEEGEIGTLGGAALGAKMGGIPGAVIGGVAGNMLTPANEENESETVDTMASYGAMGEAESSPDGNVGADDDGVYDKYDWDAQTVARKGIDEDEFEEGNAFSGALAKAHTGDKFEVGGKEFTKTTEDALEEDAWTFESLSKELDFHLIEGKDGMPTKSHIMKMCKDGKSKAEICKMHPKCDQGKLKNMIDHCKKEMKSKLDEGYTMSITQGEESQPDRVSVNATDAEADKLIKFVKDVGLGQYGDAEVVDVEPEVGAASFYGSPEVEVEPNGSHDDMLKLMGIVDMGNGDFEDEVEAPGSCGSDDISVQVDDMDEACGDKAYEDQGYNDREDEQLGMKDGKESGKKQSYADRRDDSRGDFGHRHGGHLEEKQGYDDEEDESLGMRTGKESGKHQSMKDRRDDSYGKFGKRDSEHREVSKEDIEDRGNISHKDFDQDDEKHDNYGMDDESHGRQHGALGGRGDKQRGDDSEKPMKFDEDQGYDDKEDESLGMRTGKESDHKQSDKARRDDSYGKFGKRDSEHREKSLEEMMNMIDEMSQGYDDKEDESLGMRTGKESGKHQSMKDRRNDSYGKFGKRDEEHRDHKMHEESDAERDDHAERAGKEVAHDAHYDGRRHSGRDGEDVTKDLEYDDYKDRHHMEEDQGYDDKEDESLGMRTGKESDKKQSMKDRRDDSYGKFGKRDKEDRHTSLEENLRTLDLLAEVGAESSEEPTQPLSQHDDERLLTKEGAEDAPKDSVNDGENEEITETQTDDQREFTVAEDDDLEEGKIPAGLKAYQDKKKGKKGDSEKDVDEACGDMKEEKLDEWANDAGKNGTDTSFEQDIDFMTKVISGGLNKQKSTGQTTIPVIAGQNDRMGYNGADLVKEGSVMTHDGLAGLMTKLDSLK